MKKRIKKILGFFALPLPYKGFESNKELNIHNCVIQLLKENLIKKEDIKALLQVQKMTDNEVYKLFKETIWNGFVNIVSGYGITEPPWNISGELPPPNKERIIGMFRQLANAIIYELQKLES